MPLSASASSPPSDMQPFSSPQLPPSRSTSSVYVSDVRKKHSFFCTRFFKQVIPFFCDDRTERRLPLVLCSRTTTG